MRYHMLSTRERYADRRQAPVPAGPAARSGRYCLCPPRAPASPLSLQILIFAAVLFCSVVLLPALIAAALVYAPFAVAASRRNVIASLSVAVWGLLVAFLVAKGDGDPRLPLILLAALPFATVAVAHLGALGRWYVPCRTVAWTLVWSVPVGALAMRIWPQQPFIGTGFGWLIAFTVLGWRLAKSLQDTREFTRQQARGGALAAPYGWPAARSPQRPGAKEPRGPAVPDAAGRPSDTRPGGPRPGSRRPGGRVTVVTDGAGVSQAADSGRGQSGATGPGESDQEPRQPEITVDEAMAELDAMIGLTAVKDQVRSIAASIEAARRRALAGYGTDKPMQHLVFLGPPGTGKTAVARIIAKIFYAFGLLDTPAVVEATRADLVGEYLGATAIKTNDLIDSALGGVLFIDEAYSLVNEGDGQGDRFGNEAVQALLKRAEDDRDDLVIILAGYERQMDGFLVSNPGLSSRFATRVKFPGYSPAELLSLADLAIERRGEVLDPDARPVLWRMFEDIGRRKLADDLGNARFVRSLLEKAGQARDVRVMGAAAEPSSADLVTLRGDDLTRAFSDLTTRFRGYGETPTLESALAELDALIGLEPVKRQVHEITAQLRVARLRDRQGLSSQPPARHFVFTGPPAPAGPRWPASSAGSSRRSACWSGRAWWRPTGPTSSASISATPRLRPTSWSTPRWAACCSSTRPTRCTTRATPAATPSGLKPPRRCSSGPRTTGIGW